MTGQVVYEAIKFWLPFLTLTGILYKVARAAKKSISTWADQLLDNHMAHIQKAAEEAATSLNDMSSSSKDTLFELKEMRVDFQRSYDENARNTQSILTGIEVLKVKVD